MMLSSIGLSIQTIQAQPTPDNYLDVIVTFKTIRAADSVRTKLQAVELGYSRPSEARLWRIKKGTKYQLDGVNKTIDSVIDVIGAVSGRPEAAGISENPVVKVLPTDIQGRKGTQTSIPTVTTCTTTCLLPTRPIYTQRSNFRVYVFDTGIEIINGKLSPFLRPYVDLSKAYNFVQNNSIPQDEHGRRHGTIVSNLIALSLRRLQLGTSTEKPMKIVPIKILDRDGNGWTFDLIKAFDKATNENADLINCSLILKAADFKENPLQIAIEKAKEKNILVISGAGNDRADVDVIPYFPAGLSSKNQITVGASTCDLKKAGFSNFGKLNVDLFALGENLHTLGGRDSLVVVSGTSFAAPLVTGYAAILAARSSTKNYITLKSDVMSTVRFVADLSRFCVGKGVLDVCRNTTLEKNAVMETADAAFENWQIFPNPAVTEAQIQFKLASADWVNIKIFNVFGTEIQTIANQFLEEGTYTLPLQTKPLTTGMYWVVFQKGTQVETRKMEIVK